MNLGDKSFSLFKREIFLYGLQLITSVVIARKLGPELLGISIIIGQIPTYAEIFGRLKLDLAAVYFLGKKKYTLPDVVYILNILAILTSSLLVLGYYANFDFFYSLLFAKSKENVEELIYIVLLQIPLNFIYMNYSYLLLHKEDVKNYNRMLILKSLTASVLGIVFVVGFNLGLRGIVLASTFALLISVIFGVLRIGLVKFTLKRVNFLLIKDLITYGYKLYFQGLIENCKAYTSNTIVILYLIPSQVTYFSLARGYGMLLDKIPNALGTILFPRLTKMTLEIEIIDLTNKSFRLLSFILAVSGIIAIILIFPVVQVLYGKEYLPLVGPFQILIPGIVMSGAVTPIIQHFLAVNRVDISIIISVIGLLSSIIFGFLFIPEYSVPGAAISLTFSLMISSITTIIFYLRINKAILMNSLLIKKSDISFLVNFITNKLKNVRK